MINDNGSLTIESLLNLFHVDILYHFPIQSECRFSDLKHIGRISLMHPENASGNDPQGAQPVKSLMRSGSEEDDPALLPQSQLLKGNDEGFHLLFEFGAALSPRDRLPMDTSGGVAEKSTDALRHTGAQDML